MNGVERTFEPQIGAPSAARSFVGDLLPDSFAARFDCLLLTSELVTNGVLHAGTDLRVMAFADLDWVRVEVVDGSPVEPVRRDYGVGGRTGRGLALVEALSTAWGVDHHEGGKSVWFEIGDRPAGRRSGPRRPPATVELVPIRFERPPVHLLPATLEYGEAVLRELAMMTLTGRLTDRLPQGWRVPPLQVGLIFEALASGDPEVVPEAVTVELPPGAATAALDRLALISLGDELARERRLLVPPPLPEVGLCRYWFLTEIASQAGGGSPQPWSQPELGTPIDPPPDVVPRVLAEVGGLTTATIVADDTNRIVFANQAVFTLLGWDESLIGRRLTVIIPPHLRERHLARFALLGVTGTPHIIGEPMLVPARRRDGSEVEVQLVLSVLASSGGRNLYQGELLTP